MKEIFILSYSIKPGEKIQFRSSRISSYSRAEKMRQEDEENLIQDRAWRSCDQENHLNKLQVQTSSVLHHDDYSPIHPMHHPAQMSVWTCQRVGVGSGSRRLLTTADAAWPYFTAFLSCDSCYIVILSENIKTPWALNALHDFQSHRTAMEFAHCGSHTGWQGQGRRGTGDVRHGVCQIAALSDSQITREIANRMSMEGFSTSISKNWTSGKLGLKLCSLNLAWGQVWFFYPTAPS